MMLSADEARAHLDALRESLAYAEKAEAYWRAEAIVMRDRVRRAEEQYGAEELERRERREAYAGHA